MLYSINHLREEETWNCKYRSNTSAMINQESIEPHFWTITVMTSTVLNNDLMHSEKAVARWKLSNHAVYAPSNRVHTISDWKILQENYTEDEG